MGKIAGFSKNVFYFAVIVLIGIVQLLLGIIGQKDPRLLISQLLKMNFLSSSIIFNVICDVFRIPNERCRKLRPR